MAVAAARATEASANMTRMIWGVASVLVLAVGGWVATQIAYLSAAHGEIAIRLARMEERVARLPPPELLLRLDRIETHQRETDELIRTITRRLHQKLGIETGAAEHRQRSEAQGG